MLKDVAKGVNMYGLSGLGTGHFPGATVNRIEENGAQKSRNVQFNISLKKKRQRMCFDAY